MSIYKLAVVGTGDERSSALITPSTQSHFLDERDTCIEEQISVKSSDDKPMVLGRTQNYLAVPTKESEWVQELVLSEDLPFVEIRAKMHSSVEDFRPRRKTVLLLSTLKVCRRRQTPQGRAATVPAGFSMLWKKGRLSGRTLAHRGPAGRRPRDTCKHSRSQPSQHPAPANRWGPAPCCPMPLPTGRSSHPHRQW